MITTNIMNQLAHERNLKTRSRLRKHVPDGLVGGPLEAFNLEAAVASDKPVILWHTSTGNEYIGYELLNVDSFGSGIGFTVITLRYGTSRKLYSISDFFFVEYDGFIASAPDVWPMHGVYWLGNDIIDRYHVQVQLIKKKVPECKE